MKIEVSHWESRGVPGQFRGSMGVPMSLRELQEVSVMFQRGSKEISCALLGVSRGCRSIPGDLRRFQECSKGFREFQDRFCFSARDLKGFWGPF